MRDGTLHMLREAAMRDGTLHMLREAAMRDGTLHMLREAAICSKKTLTLDAPKTREQYNVLVSYVIVGKCHHVNGATPAS